MKQAETRWPVQRALQLLLKLATGLLLLSTIAARAAYAQAPTFQDSLFRKANLRKAELVAAGDTALGQREALKTELTRLCHLAQERGAGVYATSLVRCEHLVRGLSNLHEFIEVLRDDAEGWADQRRSIGELSEVYIVLIRIKARLRDHKSAYEYINRIKSFPTDSLKVDILVKCDFLQGYLAYCAHDNEQAVIHFTSAAARGAEAEDKAFGLIVQNALSHCYNLLLDFEKGREVAQRGLERIEGLPEGVALLALRSSLHINLAEGQHGVGEKEAAYANVERALEYALESTYKVPIGNTFCIWSRLLRRDNRLAEAKEKALLALSEYEAGEDLHSVLLALEEAALTTKMAGAHAESLRYTEDYHHLKDSLNSIQLLLESNAVALIRESEQQQVELALLKEKSARQEAESTHRKMERLGLIGLAVLLGLIAFAGYFRLNLKKNLQRRLESEVKKRTEELNLQADRLRSSNEELERFAYIASHDLKTPIRNVVSFLNLIKRRMSSNEDDELAEFIQIASDNARHMHHLITDVLEFSKVNADNDVSSESFDLGAEIQLYAERFNGDGIEVDVEGEATVNAPRSMTMQVFQNLIENGLKYNDSDTKRISIRISRGDKFVRCRVSDNGIGIDPAYKDKIFELFKRLHTSDRYEGTGLGLALTKKIVDRCGGRISVDSALGAGSTFTVVLPLDCSGAARGYRPTEASVPELA